MEFKKQLKNFIQSLSDKKVGQTNLANILVKVGLFLLILVITPLLFSLGESQKFLDLKIGSISPKKVVAPFNFYILKTDKELKEEREKAEKTIPYYFNYSDSITNVQIKKLNDLIPFLLDRHDAQKQLDSIHLSASDYQSEVKDDLAILFGINTTAANVKVVFDIIQDKDRLNYLRSTVTFAKSLVRNGILDRTLASLTRPNVTVVRNGVEEDLPPGNRMDLIGFEKSIENKLLEKFDVNQTFILKYLFNQIVQPNLIYDKNFTENAVQTSINSVSLTKDMVYENERIVDANERIDDEIFQKLYSLEQAQRENSQREGNWKTDIAFLSKLMLLASIILIAGLYLYSFRKKVFYDNKTLFLITIIILLVLVLASIITGPLNWQVYVIPTTIASMLLAILVDSGIAFVSTVVIAMILGGIQGSGFDITLITIVSGIVSIYAVHRIRTRNQVFRAILYIAMAYLWIMIAITGLRFDSIIDAGKTFTISMLPNAILAPFITFMVLGVFEKLFDITTDVTLLELSDLNHPLLKRLSMEAPGTFHHSMVVGNLSESAAKAIDANSLLARVGSYYHDIGKMEKPEYFVENQMDADNRHEALSPNMSALILSSHVKNGIEMARKYGIPKLIRNFIPEHHGTNIMTYFYNKAIELAGEKEVNEADFRYPGPKPQSKETGIVMLADAVEAATRTITNPTPNKLRAFVEDLVDKRFREGELDDCDLTLRDLKKITDAFMPILYGVFQHRIEYPDVEKKKAGKQMVNPKKSNEN
jgi:putative nucleotidyltransferase with HDIG domain